MYLFSFLGAVGMSCFVIENPGYVKCAADRCAKAIKHFFLFILKLS